MTDLSNSPIGKPIVRREDRRFLTGAGQYTDDVVLPRQTYGVFVRSPHAHARIRSIGDQACRAAPGFVALFTGADLAEAKVGGLPCGWLIHSKDGTPMKEPPHPVLAQGKVRHVGDALALVVAETVLEHRERALGEAADIGGEPGRLLVGQDPAAGVVHQRPLHAQEGVGHHVHRHLVGRVAGLGGEHGGQGVGGASDRLLLASL